jgi:enoyl-CoA hydratase/carnithine racemase
MAATKQAAQRKTRAGSRTADLEIERRGGILVLTLARPDKRNTLSETMLAALQKAVQSAAEDKGVHVVVIAAQGNTFCAGHDLKEFTRHRNDSDGGRAYHTLIMRRCSEFMRSIVLCPKPVIAAVQGTATAAGCQLVATCDLAVASEEASFVTPGVNIGLFCSTPMVALSRNVPRKRAMEMLLLGDAVSARQAADYGLVNRVVPSGQLMAETMRLAEAIAAKPPATVAVGKEAFYRQTEMALAQAYDYASSVMVENMMHVEAEEGIGAFIDKRVPVWGKS